MKILRLGDMHVKVSNLEESERLLKFVLDTALERKIDRLEILGDLYDTHSIIRLEVMEFWDRWLHILAKQSFNTVVLVGNHDISGNYSTTYSSLSPFRDLDIVVYEPEVTGPFGYLPYIHDRDEFIKEANNLANLGARFLVSHNTYEGSKYDNGMYAPDGVDPDLVDDRIHTLLSGHVHTEQEFGRVVYPGTARWSTQSDANKRKGLHLFTHDKSTGTILDREFISTEGVCVPIISIEYREGGESLPNFPDNGRINVHLVGSSDWIAKTKLELKGTCSITTKITDSKKSKERKSGRSLHEFLTNHYSIDSAKRTNLIVYMEKMQLV